MTNQREIKRLISQFLNGVALAVISGTIILPMVNGTAQPGPAIVGVVVVGLCLLSSWALWSRS